MTYLTKKDFEKEWRDIEGYEGFYMISNYGEAWSCRSNKTLNLEKRLAHHKYAVAGLYDGKKVKNKLVSRLVAKAFIANPYNFKVVNHIDGNPMNNRIDNLEWCSHRHNIIHAYKNKLFKTKADGGIRTVNGRYVAYSTCFNKRLCIGTFDDIELAKIAMGAAKKAIEFFYNRKDIKI